VDQELMPAVLVHMFPAAAALPDDLDPEDINV
jgi:hypothetical protein